jgi:hypothetical protein
LAPTCSNCASTEFVWANEVKTGTAGGLSLRPKGEAPIGTRICKNCGHADLFLHDLELLKKPHLWKPGEFYPITSKPATPAESGPGSNPPAAPRPEAPISAPMPLVPPAPNPSPNAPSPQPGNWPSSPPPPSPPGPDSQATPENPPPPESTASEASSTNGEGAGATTKSRGSRRRGAKSKSDDTTD